MKIRLATMCKYVPDEKVHDRKVMNIIKLFALNSSFVPTEHAKILSDPLGFPILGKTYWKKIHLTHGCYLTNTKLIRQQIEGIKLSTDFPIAILHPVKKDALDLCLKILVPGHPKPIYIFVDNKAAAETKDSAEKALYNINDNRGLKGENGIEELPKEGKQYTQTREVMEGLEFVYIYARTHKSIAFTVENAIELDRDDSFCFLGPLSDLYQTSTITIPE